MRITVVALSLLVPLLALTVPVRAQIRNPSQDFFEQGREQLEREIQILQADPFTLEGNLGTSPSQPEPSLEASPVPTNPPSENPNEVKTPTQQPNEVDNQVHEDQRQ